MGKTISEFVFDEFSDESKVQQMFSFLSNEMDGNDFLEFDLVENKHTNRPDLHAFILLDKLIPGSTGDIIDAAEHDEFYLSINIDDLEKVITIEIAQELSRCGVMYNSDHDCLYMFA